ncbi:carboxylate--amine ligase [Lacticaseibacillus songhuajiangensis]|jgi:D-aspartate ligase|uniref:carboxylate--amine ligase n=1 Tax=Lacticaseibacillus songhuajiangensis TaxID=1296539 RepID=UPI000F799DE4|nr:carboxylate--amine ligase [Lacticaseibacillus songhuajiangensis]MCI1282966.1 carboxylate--amine ligase [Lacticaseibacillus songhuajiangensis]
MADVPNFTPILLGSDMNVYGMARSFHEISGQTVDVYARLQLAPTRFSKIVNVHLIEDFDSDPAFIEAMRKIADSYKGHNEKLILIACGDGYAELISKHKDELSETFVCPYVDYKMLKRLNSKESFYEVCDEYDLPYPSTKIITKAMYESGVSITPPFPFPVALKPTNSVEWLNIHFEGRKKAFTIHSQVELNTVIGKIYDNGYTSDLILQDFVPGDDSHMRVLNAYVDQNHQVKMMCLGHPLLEDPTPAAIGNYVAILPEYNQPLYDKMKKFLEDIQFTGFANFDMKYDERDQTFKLFEINIRQGRSSFFVTLNGYNLASWLVKDYVTGELSSADTVFGNQDDSQAKLWLGVPKKIFRKYAKDNEYKARALKLLEEGRVGTTVFYKKDMNLKRWALMEYMFYNYYGRYKRYFAENKGDN